MELTDEQWEVIEAFIPSREKKAPGRQGGRPWQSARDVLDGVLWVLRTGAPWADLPRRYPPYQTCHRRFQRWVKQGVLEKILRALAEDLRDRGKLDLTEAYIDASHAGAKKGALWLGGLDADWRPSSWQLRTATVFQSPQGLDVVQAMKRPSSKPRSKAVSSTSSPSA